MVVFFYIYRTLDLKQGRNHSFNSVLFRPIDRTEMGLHSFRYQFWSISAESEVSAEMDEILYFRRNMF